MFLSFFLGLAAGGFFSLMSSSFAYEDPLLRQNLNTTQKSVEIFKEMGRGMWKSGKGFSKVGALYAGIECVIESVRGYFCYEFSGARRADGSVSRYSTEREMIW
jgi:hypothetical protein